MRIDKRTKIGAAAPPSGAPRVGLIGACTTALERMASTLRDMGSAAPSGDVAVERTALRRAAAQAQPHLTKLTSVVETAARHVERAEQCHRGAGIRIDAALYELEQLRMELQAVVDPALLQGTSRILDADAASSGTKSGVSPQAATEPAKAGPARSARSAA
jgi:hypothetical protein